MHRIKVYKTEYDAIDNAGIREIVERVTRNCEFTVEIKQYQFEPSFYVELSDELFGSEVSIYIRQDKWAERIKDEEGHTYIETKIESQLSWSGMARGLARAQATATVINKAIEIAARLEARLNLIKFIKVEEG